MRLENRSRLLYAATRVRAMGTSSLTLICALRYYEFPIRNTEGAILQLPEAAGAVILSSEESCLNCDRR